MHEISNRIKSLSEQLKIICLVIGILYSSFAGFGLFIVLIQKLMMAGTGMKVSEWKEMQTIHTIFMIYLPIVIILGISYIKFGVSLTKTPKNPMQTSKVLWLISAIISISYSTIAFTIVLKDVFQYFSFMALMTIVSSAFGFIIVILALNLPQFFISKKIKELTNIKNQS